jgi:hypothetical protein
MTRGDLILGGVLIICLVFPCVYLIVRLLLAFPTYPSPIFALHAFLLNNMWGEVGRGGVGC